MLTNHNRSNEPDNAGQADLDVADCVTVYKKYMQPFYGQVQLGTPAVTNGGGQTGLQYLSNFVGNCTDCSFNFINVHHYLQRSDFNVTGYAQALKDYIENDIPAVQSQYKALEGLPIFIGEVRPIHPFPNHERLAVTNVHSVVALGRHRRGRRRSHGCTPPLPR